MFVRVLNIVVFIFLITFTKNIRAQSEHSQLPKFLQNSFFEVNIGVINYPFSQAHLEEGFTFHSVQIPPIAVRLVLFGYQINKNLSYQISYMRPVVWMKYKYTVDELQFDHLLDLRVWMNYASLSMKYKHSLNKRLAMFAEGAYTIVTRNGYTGWYGTVIKNAKYSSVQIGGGLTYELDKKWGLSLSGIFTPQNKKEKQPHTSFISTGFSYHLQAYTKKQVEKTSKSSNFYPKQIIQLGFSSNAFGFGVNNFLERVYLFWGGKVQVNHGLSVTYQRNIFHSSKVFSMDWGANFSIWKSELNNETFITLSVFPVLRFTFLRTRSADAYLFYSVAGPTFISHISIDGVNTGGHFTFQDNMGVGLFFGRQKKYNAEIRIGHYSNGNILPRNPGIKIPLTFNLGFTF